MPLQIGASHYEMQGPKLCTPLDYGWAPCIVFTGHCDQTIRPKAIRLSCHGGYMAPFWEKKIRKWKSATLLTWASWHHSTTVHILLGAPGCFPAPGLTELLFLLSRWPHRLHFQFQPPSGPLPACTSSELRQSPLCGILALSWVCNFSQFSNMWKFNY